MKKSKTSYYSFLFFLFITPSFFCALVLFQWVYGDMIVGHFIWKWGVALAFSLTLSLGCLTFIEISQRWRDLARKEKELEELLIESKRKRADLDFFYKEKIQEIETLCQQERERFRSILENKETEIEIIREEGVFFLGEKKVLQDLLFDYERSLKEALSALREERFQSHLLQDKVDAAPDSLLYLHRQLREQFEEKKKKIEEMKRALFQVEEELILLKKERVENIVEKEISDLTLLMEENIALTEENQLLEELVSFSLKSPTTTTIKKKAVVKTVSEREPEFNFTF